jgi:hypothetical protein
LAREWLAVSHHCKQVQQEVPAPSTIRRSFFLAKQERLLDYQQDFLDFAKSSASSAGLEYVRATELADYASMAEDQLDAASTLLKI